MSQKYNLLKKSKGFLAPKSCSAFFCENGCYHPKRRQQYTGYTELSSKFTAQLSDFNLEKKKDINQLEIKDK